MLMRVLKLCFSEAEWEWLQQETLFRAAAQSVHSLAEVQKVSELGHRLITLSERGKGTRPPPGRRTPSEAS